MHNFMIVRYYEDVIKMSIYRMITIIDEKKTFTFKKEPIDRERRKTRLIENFQSYHS